MWIGWIEFDILLGDVRSLKEKEDIIRKEPDVVLTVRDASRVQLGLHGAPGTVRVIDPQTVYLRMPPHFISLMFTPSTHSATLGMSSTVTQLSSAIMGIGTLSRISFSPGRS